MKRTKQNMKEMVRKRRKKQICRTQGKGGKGGGGGVVRGCRGRKKISWYRALQRITGNSLRKRWFVSFKEFKRRNNICFLCEIIVSE